MPEEIPAVEDIKYARKRLEELEYHENAQSPSFDQKLAEKLEESELPRYKLPYNIEILGKLARIIKGYP